jgi:hypothetical protein
MNTFHEFSLFNNPSEQSVSLMPIATQSGLLATLCAISLNNFRTGSRTVARNGESERFGSITNPLHILEQNLLAAAVIKLRGPAIGVPGDSLSGFKGAVIFQKIRDAGRSE